MVISIYVTDLDATMQDVAKNPTVSFGSFRIHAPG